MPQKWLTRSCGGLRGPLLPLSLDLNLLLGQTLRKQQPSCVSTEPGAHLQAVPSPCSQMAKISHTTKPKALFPCWQVEFQHCQQISSYAALAALLQAVFGDLGLTEKQKMSPREGDDVSTGFFWVCFAVKQCREFC